MKSKIFNTLSFSVIEKILKVFFSFLSVSLIAKNYTISEFGIYSYYMALFAIFTVCISFGTDQIIAFNTKEKSLLNISDYLIYRVLVSIISAFLIIILYSLKVFSDTMAFLFCIALILQSIYVIIPYNQALMNYKIISILISLSIFISFLLKLFLIYTYKVNDFSLIIVIDSILISISLFLYIIFFNREIFNFSYVTKSKLMVIFKSSYPLFISAIGIILYSRIDQIMIKYFIGKESVGLYSAIIKLSEIFTFILPVVLNIALSYFSRAGSFKLLKFLKIMNLYSIISILSIFIFSKFIISFIYTDEYLDVLSVLYVYSLSLVFITMGTMSNIWLIERGLQKYKVNRVLLGLFINIALNFMLIPEFGLIGAAVATLISQAISSLFANYFFKETKVLFKLQLESLKVYNWKS